MDNKPGITISRIPATTGLLAGRFVSATGNVDEIAQSGANADGLGVLMMGPDTRLPAGAGTAGAQRLEVAISGVVPVDAGAAIADGQYVVSDANGKAIPDPVTGGATSFIRGKALGAVSSGDITNGVQVSIQLVSSRSKN